MNNPKSRDPDNEAFWNYMHDIFAVTMEMVQDYARKHNIDLSVPLGPEETAREEELDREADEHPLVTAGLAYMEKVRDWFNDNKPIFEQAAEQFESRLEMELPADNPESELQNLHNAIEIIQWYFAFIAVKLRRAVHGLLDPLDLDEEELKGIPSDADGSAKIALIGMDRSIAAWSVILKSMPEREKEILGFLVQLERLRRQAEQTFPKAQAFVRLGFDEE